MLEPHFFASRVIDEWNYLPENIVDFSSLAAFQRTITLVDFNVFLEVFNRKICLCLF